jgi:hypothetical protein
MEKPIQQDKAFLKAMYDRYSYLQDFPCEFKGIIEEALSLGTLHSDEFLGLLIAYPTEEEILTHDHFPYLPPEVNLKISHYRQLTPVQPRPQPIIGVAMAGDRGQVTGTHRIPVVLDRIGNCQVRYGSDVGFIFEAFLERSIQGHDDFELLMNQVWLLCEEYLKRQGVKTIYTLARDPILNESWFRGHLGRRRYSPIEEDSVVWVKQVGIS